MAYTPHTWKVGDTITADLLNALEQGVGAAKDGAKGEAGVSAPTIKSIAIDATAGTATLTMSDDSTVAGTYTGTAAAG